MNECSCSYESEQERERERERELYRFSQGPTVSHLPVCAPHLSCVPELPWDRRVVDPANKADQVLKLIQTNDPKIITKQSKGEVKLFNHVDTASHFASLPLTRLL